MKEDRPLDEIVEEEAWRQLRWGWFYLPYRALQRWLERELWRQWVGPILLFVVLSFGFVLGRKTR